MHEQEFYKGNYKQILAATVDSVAGEAATPSLPFVIGALTFRGRLEEAEYLFTHRRADLAGDGLFLSRFFLGVGLCRQSSYAKARRNFAANLRAAGRSACPKQRFYAWQGLGFYRHFCGRHRDALRAAKRSREAALEANFLYGKTLAFDLMAHNLALTGQVSAALECFNDAAGYAELLGDGGLLQALKVSLAIHSASFGLAPATDVAALTLLTSTIASEDNYSKSRLLLELGRQHTLRGDVDAAKSVLDQACRLIYGAHNRRYGIQLNLRYAHLMYLSGELHQALNLLRNAAMDLDHEVDRALVVESSGLERKILRALKLPPRDEGRDEQLVRTTAQTGQLVARRILAREQPDRLTLARVGEDPLGDLLDLAALGSAGATAAIVERGFLGLLLGVIPGSLGARALVFDLVPGRLVVIDKGGVRCAPSGFNSVLRAIARVLSAGEATKQELIERVWGYRYQALKHDALIYRNISRFRALLGRCAHWLEVTESGYQFASGVEIRLEAGASDGQGDDDTTAEAAPTGRASSPGATATPATGGASPTSASPVALDTPHAEGVNFRQLKILEHLAQHEFIDVRSAAELFDAAEVTLRRDLVQLVKLDALERIGKGRATRYRRKAGGNTWRGH